MVHTQKCVRSLTRIRTRTHTQPKTRQYQSGLDELTRNLNFIKSSVEKEELVSNGSAKSDQAQNKSAAELIGLCCSPMIN